MATRLYFHAANSGVSGTLPSTEQSTLTAGSTGDAQSVNRSMDTTKGTSQATVSDAPIGSEITNHYFTKFVSPMLNQTSVASNTWTYAFTASEGDTSNNFPVDGTNNPVRVNCYVWKPSNGTKYGTILDGNTASTVDEGSANQQRWHIVTFSGAAVSSLTAGDAVIVFEVWFVCDTSASVGGQDIFYFDGTNDTTAENGTTTSAASYLETPETLTFEAGGQTFTRTPSDTITLSDSTVRALVGRVLSDTVITSESQQRLATFLRTPATESTTLSESIESHAIRPRSVEDTTSLSESTLRILTSVRTPSDTVTQSDTVQRLAEFIRNVQDSVTLNETLDAAKIFIRQVADTILLSETIDRLALFIRNLQDNTTLNESIERIKTAPRAVQDTVTLSESTSRILTALRQVSDTVNLSEQIQRIFTALREVSDTIGLSEVVDAIKNPGGGTLFTRNVSDTITTNESLQRFATFLRQPRDSISITDIIQRFATFTKLVQDTITLSDTVQRFYIFVRTAQDTVSISEAAIQRLASYVRNISDTANISETLKALIPGIILPPSFPARIRSKRKVKGSGRKVRGSGRKVTSTEA